jgi:hypothetical protein
MNQTIRVRYRRLRNGEHSQLHRDQSGAVSRDKAVEYGFEDEYDAYAAARADEEAILKPAQGYEDTPEVEEKDHARDRLLLYVDGTIRTNLYAPDEAKRTAAVALDFNRKNYKTTVRKSYADETALIRNYCHDLKSAAKAPHLATLGLTDPVDMLETLNEEFATLYGERSMEAYHKDLLMKLPEARLHTDETAEAMFDTIDWLYAANEKTAKDATKHDDLGGMINGINAHAHWANKVLERRAGGDKSADYSDDPTPDKEKPGEAPEPIVPDGPDDSGNGGEGGSGDSGSGNPPGGDKPPNPEEPDK